MSIAITRKYVLDEVSYSKYLRLAHTYVNHTGCGQHRNYDARARLQPYEYKTASCNRYAHVQQYANCMLTVCILYVNHA